MSLPDAILLVGGRGSRVAHLHPEVPKPLIAFQGRPFLEWLLLWLVRQGVQRVILAVGYRQEKIRTYFEQCAQAIRDIECVYSEEKTPMGTGGAAIKASRLSETPRSLVLNGDSICLIDINEFVQKCCAESSPVGMVCTKVADVARFGAVECQSGRVVSFVEKGLLSGPGLINAGIYCIESSMLQSMPDEPKSLEYDLLPGWVDGCSVYGHLSASPFLDIGTPDSLHAVDTFLIRNKSDIWGAL